MPQHAVPGPLREADLGDQFRTSPVGAAFPYLPLERRDRLPQSLQPAAQVEQSGPVEPGAHLAGVAQAPVLVVAEQQRAEAGAAARRLGEASDDELLPGGTL